MADLLDLAAMLARAGQLQKARVLTAADGAGIEVQTLDGMHLPECQILYTGANLSLSAGDEVLVWLQDREGTVGVVLGRLDAYMEPSQPVVPIEKLAARPKTLVLEAQDEIVLRNGHAKIRIGADGDIEIVCRSLISRSQRLLRLLAPLIKLN